MTNTLFVKNQDRDRKEIMELLLDYREGGLSRQDSVDSLADWEFAEFAMHVSTRKLRWVLWLKAILRSGAARAARNDYLPLSVRLDECVGGLWTQDEINAVEEMAQSRLEREREYSKKESRQ